MQEQFINIGHQEMKTVFQTILEKYGLNKQKAITCAEVFTANSIDGVITHGVNRFSRFVEYIQKGYVKLDTEATLFHKSGGLEQWNGNLAPGILNAIHATQRATLLAKEFGIGCVGLFNTNHWMRGGFYGRQSAKSGCVFIGWTNTIANMPAWGATDCRLGNNPIVIAIPYKEEAIVLDMAMSQFSFGAMEKAALNKTNLSHNGGYDEHGNLTSNPSFILKSNRSLPIGFWKGSGLSLLLDILAAILSGGLATHQISKQDAEFGMSQTFIALDLAKLHNYKSITNVIEDIINDYKKSILENSEIDVLFPGERVLKQRNKNMAEGILVSKKIWEKILMF